MLPDSVRNYMTKFVDDQWMKDHHFVGGDVIKGEVSDLLANKPAHDLISLEQDRTVQEGVSLMRDKGISQIPVTDGGALLGPAHRSRPAGLPDQRQWRRAASSWST